MANDYYNNLPPVEKSSSSVIDPSLFAGAMTAALDAAAKQSNIAMGMSNQADNALFAQQERARREAEARIEQQQRDLEQSNNIRAQTAYQEETTKYLANVQAQAVKTGNLLTPQQIENDVKQIGNKYLGTFKSQTGKASFEAMVSQNALSASGNAVSMNEKVVKDQALTTLKYIQDDAAKKFIQDPSRSEQVLLESQQRLSQLPLSKEMKFAADLGLQQAFGDNYLQNLAGTDTKTFLETFKNFDRPATPEGLKRALSVAYTAEEKRLGVMNDAIKLMAKNTLAGNEELQKLTDAALKKSNKEIADMEANYSTATSKGATTGKKSDREAAENVLSMGLGFRVDQAIGNPQATAKVLDTVAAAKVNALPESFYNVLVSGAKGLTAESVAVGFQMFKQIEQNPALKNALLELPAETRARYRLYEAVPGLNPQSKFDAFNGAYLEPEMKGTIPQTTLDVLKPANIIDMAKDVLDFDKIFRFDEHDERYQVVAFDVELAFNRAINNKKYTPEEVTEFIKASLEDKWTETRMNGNLIVVRKGAGPLPENVDEFLAPQLRYLADQYPNEFKGVFGNVLESNVTPVINALGNLGNDLTGLPFTPHTSQRDVDRLQEDKTGLLTGDKPIVNYAYSAAPIKDNDGNIVAHGFFTMSKNGIELTAPDEFGIPRPLVVYNFDTTRYKEAELMVKNQQSVDAINLSKQALAVIAGKL